MKKIVLLILLCAAATAAAAKESNNSTPTWNSRGGPCLIVVSTNGYVINANALSSIIPRQGHVEYRFARHQEIEISTSTPQAEVQRVMKEIETKCGGAR